MVKGLTAHTIKVGERQYAKGMPMFDTCTFLTFSDPRSKKMIQALTMDKMDKIWKPTRMYYVFLVLIFKTLLI